MWDDIVGANLASDTRAVEFTPGSSESEALNAALVVCAAYHKKFAPEGFAGFTKLSDAVLFKLERNSLSPRLTREEILACVEALSLNYRMGHELTDSGLDQHIADVQLGAIKSLVKAL